MDRSEGSICGEVVEMNLITMQCDFCVNKEDLVSHESQALWGWFKVTDYKGDREDMCPSCYAKTSSKRRNKVSA